MTASTPSVLSVVATALRCMGDGQLDPFNSWEDEAQWLLRALDEAGLVVAPKEATEAMLSKGVEMLRIGDCDWDSEGDAGDAAAIDDVYRAMIAGRPSSAGDGR